MSDLSKQDNARNIAKGAHQKYKERGIASLAYLELAAINGFEDFRTEETLQAQAASESGLSCDLCKKGIQGSSYYEDREKKQNLCFSCFESIASDDDRDLEKITDKEILEWCQGTLTDYTLDRLKTILTGEYDLTEARQDALSFKRFKIQALWK